MDHHSNYARFGASKSDTAAADHSAAVPVHYPNGHRRRHSKEEKPRRDRVATAMDSLEVSRGMMREIDVDSSDRDNMAKTLIITDQLTQILKVLRTDVGDTDPRTAHANYLLGEIWRMLYNQTKDFQISHRLQEKSHYLAQRVDSAMEVDSVYSGSSRGVGSNSSASTGSSMSGRENDFDDEDVENQDETLTEEPLETNSVPEETTTLTLPPNRQVILQRSIDYFRNAEKVYEDRFVQKNITVEENRRLVDIYSKLSEYDCERYEVAREANERMSTLNSALVHLEKAKSVLNAVDDPELGSQLKASISYMLCKLTNERAIDICQNALEELLDHKRYLEQSAAEAEFGGVLPTVSRFREELFELEENIDMLSNQLACFYVAKSRGTNLKDARKAAQTFVAQQAKRRESVSYKPSATLQNGNNLSPMEKLPNLEDIPLPPGPYEEEEDVVDCVTDVIFPRDADCWDARFSNEHCAQLCQLLPISKPDLVCLLKAVRK